MMILDANFRVSSIGTCLFHLLRLQMRMGTV
jgi:hypothetical protein